MKFSVIIPLYNKRTSVRRAIHSVFDQLNKSARQCELIIVDDGSNDGSLDVVNEIQREYSNREIIVYSQANAGVSAARNKGVELASADFVTFLDADDTYEPNFLCEIESLIDNFPEAVMLATAYRFIDTNTGQKRDAHISGIGSEQQQVCINKYALKELGGFPIEENMGEDQAVWSQIALNHVIAISQKVCANYFEDTANSLMQTVSSSDEMPFSKRLQCQLDQGEILGEYVPSVKTYIAGHLLDLVRRNIQTGDIKSARALSRELRLPFRTFEHQCG